MDVANSGSESDNDSRGLCDERQQSRASDGDATAMCTETVTDGEREATASMTTDSGGGIEAYVNTVITITENSGYGTVDRVVHTHHTTAKTSHDGSRAALHSAGKAGVRQPQPPGKWY